MIVIAPNIILWIKKDVHCIFSWKYKEIHGGGNTHITRHRSWASVGDNIDLNFEFSLAPHFQSELKGWERAKGNLGEVSLTEASKTYACVCNS